jgi:lipopolysaccharide biosynthesis glycosyltransferase
MKRKFKYLKKRKKKLLSKNYSYIGNKKKYSLFFFFKIITFIFLMFLFLILDNKIEKNLFKLKDYINVAYCFDNKHIYITYISMKSIMLSQNKNTFINFYLLVSAISDIEKEIIENINEEHKNCKLKYLEIGDQFKDLNIPRDIWSTPMFYRILLQDLLPNIDKILYLDTDTLIYKDLNKIYNYNITGKYYVGMLEKWHFYKQYFKKFNVKFTNFINTGVLLCNLEELRKGNISEKIKNVLIKYNKQLEFPINEALNYVTHEKNGYFSEEYVVIGFCDRNQAFSYYKDSEIKLNNTKVLNSYEDPYIYHLIIYSKPWIKIHYYNGKACLDRITRFYEIARKTKFYHKIFEKYPIK